MPTGTIASRRQRADAQRNRAAILQAAAACLARDPDATLQQIAEAAGVGRVTLHAHYGSRAALIAAVVEQAMESTNAALRGLDLTGDPVAALTRLMSITWDLTHAHGALVVAAQNVLPADQVQEFHREPHDRARRLLAAGRTAGAFRSDLPLDWQIITIQAILHGATEAVYRGEVTPEEARDLVVRTVLITVAEPTAS